MRRLRFRRSSWFGRAAFLGLALSLGGVLASSFGGCSSPSSTLDGGNLLGLYEKDAGAADASADARSGKDGGKSSAKVTVPAGPVRERKPVTGTCVAKQGEADHELRRTLGRPACRDELILESRDADGSPRYACVMARGAEARAPLPLVVLFHGPEGTPATVEKSTTWKKLAPRFPVSADPAHPGFVVLLPQGRMLRRDKSGPIFDTDFIGEGNVDVDMVDKFIAQLVQKKLVDTRRIYTVGESKGGYMAATYAMLRADKVAAFAAFGADAPAAAWTCSDVPPPPALLLYRACDAVAPCDSVEAWVRAREKAQAETVSIRLGDQNQEEVSCAVRNKCSKIKGTANHGRWPKGKEEDILRFFAKHALSADSAPPGEAPAPSASGEPEAPEAPGTAAPQ